MSPPDAPYKKKSPPLALPRALDEGVAPRPLFPAHRVAIPIGLVTIGAIAFLELSPATIDPDTGSCATKPSIFDRGAEAAKDAFARVMGRSYASPGYAPPTVAGGAMAIAPPTGTTPAGPTVEPNFIGPLAPPVTSSRPNTKFVSPGTTHPRLGGRPVSPRR